MKREDALQIEPNHMWFPKARKLENDLLYTPSRIEMCLIFLSEKIFASVKNSNDKKVIEEASLGQKLLIGEYCWSQGTTRDSVSQGDTKSFLRQCGAMLNKFYGPLSPEGKKKWFFEKEKNKKSSGGLADFDRNLFDNDKYDGYKNQPQ